MEQTCSRCDNKYQSLPYSYRLKTGQHLPCCEKCEEDLQANKARVQEWKNENRSRNRELNLKWAKNNYHKIYAWKRKNRQRLREERERNKPPEVCPLYKPCKFCTAAKHRRDFNICKTHRDGRSNVCKKCHADRNNDWRKSNPERTRLLRRFNEGTRRATLAKATPKWADMEAIRRCYENCPRGMEVDHIVPILGKDVTGLHVLCNLQYLSSSDNRKKRNRLVL